MADDLIQTTQLVASELRATVGRFRRRLREEADPGDFTESQKSVLARLDRDGPSTLAELARAEGMRSQSMGAIVAALSDAGLISGAPHPTDGRQTILSLVPEAQTRLREGRAARQDWLSRTIAARLTPAEQEELTRSLRLIARLLEP